MKSLFIQFLKHDSAQHLTIRKAVTRIGQQEDTELWILAECVQVDAHGLRKSKFTRGWSGVCNNG